MTHTLRFSFGVQLARGHGACFRAWLFVCGDGCLLSQKNTVWQIVLIEYVMRFANQQQTIWIWRQTNEMYVRTCFMNIKTSKRSHCSRYYTHSDEYEERWTRMHISQDFWPSLCGHVPQLSRAHLCVSHQAPNKTKINLSNSLWSFRDCKLCHNIHNHRNQRYLFEQMVEKGPQSVSLSLLSVPPITNAKQNIITLFF